MNARNAAAPRSHRTLRLAVMAAALGVAGMFTAAATFAASDAQANDAPAAVEVAAR